MFFTHPLHFRLHDPLVQDGKTVDIQEGPARYIGVRVCNNPPLHTHTHTPYRAVVTTFLYLNTVCQPYLNFTLVHTECFMVSYHCVFGVELKEDTIMYMYFVH